MTKLIPVIKLAAAKNAQADEYFRDVLENAKVCPGSGSGTPGSGSGNGTPIQPGPGGDDPDL